MLELKCDYMATGHYAKVINGKLYKSSDLNKDQTYFLCELKKEQLNKIFEALMKLKDWNYKYIYASSEANKHQQLVEELFYELYHCYLKKVEQYDENKKLTQSEKNLYEFINGKNDWVNIKRTIIDYIAGQTDQYFLKECVENVRKFNIDELYK